VSLGTGVLHRQLQLAGGRAEIRRDTVSAALNLLVSALVEDNE
jgi:hypothetical protein